MLWPGNKSFAFSIFDDTDSQTLEKGKAVYALLSDLGFRTTKSVWPIRGKGTPSDNGATCEENDYRQWVQSLQRQGFEVGYHMAASHTSPREETVRGLEQFAQHFGGYPITMASHYFSDENLYWGDARLSGANRLFYNLVTRFRNHNRYYGHVPGHPYFWGDLCKEKIKYVRNFCYPDVNTLKACPCMPYHDPWRPLVNYWFASSEGAQAGSFVRTLAEANQDQLEAEGGACIMYAHFGLGFCEDGRLNARFRSLMERLSQKNGWFVPVATLLDYLLAHKVANTIGDAERARLERKWLWHKLRSGTE
jgi:hypothetical protein